MADAMWIMKQLRTALSLLALFTSAEVMAVSLGDELILSRLGDPVEVEIEVLQWEDMDLARVQISAASQEEYEVFDLTWLPVLEDLRFNLIGPDLDGDVRVLVSSREPLEEPFLELLLVLRWPGGSLRREYVLLFDPPEPVTPVVRTPAISIPAPESTPVIQAPEPLAEPVVPVSEVQQPLLSEPVVITTTVITPAPEPPIQAAPPQPVQAPPVPQVAVEEAIVEPIVEEIIETDVEEVVVEVVEVEEPPRPAVVIEEPVTAEASPDARTQLAIEVETLSPQTPAPAALDTTRRTYQVHSGSSLWNIARQFRPAGAGENLYQMLLSLHNLNRSSFINGNISLLKANAVLQIPTADDINRIDPLTAEAEFDRRWDEGTQRIEAAQRGELIPLFANNVPAAELDFNEADDNLPPGTEAPDTDTGENELIMVSQTNVPQPLQITTDGNVVNAGTAAADASAAPLAAVPEPAPIIVRIETTTSTRQTPTAEGEPLSPGTAQASSQNGVVVRAIELRRGEIAAELENELTAMRARRQSAEAIASQLNAALQQAQAAQAARNSLLGPDNVLLVVSALALFAALLASIVFSLKVAGDLRLRRVASGGTMLERQAGGPAWFAERQSLRAERKEPHLPEMDVVEMQLAKDASGNASASRTSPLRTPVSGTARTPTSGDLFARMDDLLADDDPNSGKNA